MEGRIGDFYKKYPDMLIENVLECQLYWYQKVSLRLLLGNKKNKMIRKDK